MPDPESWLRFGRLLRFGLRKPETRGGSTEHRDEGAAGELHLVHSGASKPCTRSFRTSFWLHGSSATSADDRIVEPSLSPKSSVMLLGTFCASRGSIVTVPELAAASSSCWLNHAGNAIG